MEKTGVQKRAYSNDELAAMSPKEFRDLCRRGEWTEPISGIRSGAARGYAIVNLAIVPSNIAFEFLMFCNRNPRPCPVLEVTEPGNPHPTMTAPEADLRTDLPKYRVFKDGQMIDEPIDITNYWRDDLVAFLIGCSLSFDWVLKAANIQYRLTGSYWSNIQCVPAGSFHGNMQVSTRLVKGTQDAVRAVQISSRYPLFHGPPVHFGDPAAIGIKDLYRPTVDRGFIAPQEPDEIAMHWGCGITPQLVAIESKVPFLISHSPGCLFVTDRRVEEFATLA